MKPLTKRIVIIVVVLAVVGVIAAGFLKNSSGGKNSYQMVKLKRGDLLATIGATGTVEPEEVIDVGAQVAGQIYAFGKDKDGKTVDYGSVVEEGTVLAQIDETVYAANVAQASAQLLQAKAGVLRAEADLEQLKARLYQAQRDWDRAQKLGPSEALAESSFDAYKAAYETAKANVTIGEATIEQDKASVTQSEAALQSAQRNLSYCTIKSPVKGVIIDRRVNIGQTVVSSLNAPSLFLIAKDLKRMQVWVSVNESDIGKIHPGQAVSFTVSAYPDEVFRGEVGKIRLNATMTQNVVTYTVEVTTDNSSGKLLPYLTATVDFEVNSRSNVLLVPKAALRWIPKPEQVSAEFRDSLSNDSGQSEGRGRGQSAAGGSPNQEAAAPSDKNNQQVVWVQQGNFVRPIKVHTGLDDKTMIEVESNELKEGLDVVVGEQQQATGSTGATNPFVPQFRRGR
jgi:HlyD family secretion protein